MTYQSSLTCRVTPGNIYLIRKQPTPKLRTKITQEQKLYKNAFIILFLVTLKKALSLQVFSLSFNIHIYYIREYNYARLVGWCLFLTSFKFIKKKRGIIFIANIFIEFSYLLIHTSFSISLDLLIYYLYDYKFDFTTINYKESPHFKVS